MNWNSQRETLNYLIKCENDPDNAPSFTKDFQNKRWQRVLDAVTTRPVFIPLSYTLFAAGQVPPFKATTPLLGYNVYITGIKTDIWPARDIEIRIGNNEPIIVRSPDGTNTLLRSDDLMGSTVDAGGGQIGTFYLPEPILIPAEQTVSVSVYKTDATANDINANIVLVGLRVYDGSFAASILNQRQRDIISRILSLRDTPVSRFLKLPITYSAATAGITATGILGPRLEEPVILYGMRSTFRRSLINIGISGEAPWTVSTDVTPIWGVAAEDTLENDNYQWFSRGVYLPAGASVVIPKIINSIDGTLIEDTGSGTSGELTIFYKTI